MPRTRFAPAGLALLLALSGCDTPPAPPPVDPTPPSDPQSAKTTGAPAAQLIQLDNGLATYLEIAPRGMPSQITFGVFAGSLFMAPGLAELTAHVIVQSADPKSGRRSLAQQIRAAGGTVDVNVGLTSTWIDIRVPAGREPTALAALR
ncbi:MAG TPA: hypothetical protein ENI87_14730, partial [bacterium]|nr:hypothetical protein [bacterium]